MERTTMSVLVAVLIMAIFAASSVQATNVGYYSSTCPKAESIIKKTVAAHFRSDKTVAAALLRMSFHDCFVQGCDGSILLDSSDDGSVIEKEAAPNKNSVRGYEVIDDAKQKLESACPGVVSCADIIQVAARDAVDLTNGPQWDVATGRFDGRISRASEANARLPAPFFTVAEMTQSFADVGLSSDDLVNLLGAHTIGRTKCSLFQDRLYNFSGTGKPDPTLSTAYLVQLQKACPKDSNADPTVTMDRGTEFKFDNNYFKELIANRGVLQADQELTHDASTQPLVQSYSVPNKAFFNNFVTSMNKMANIDIKTASNGEIRLNCRVLNKASNTVTTS